MTLQAAGLVPGGFAGGQAGGILRLRGWHQRQ
jgi:hypothetical protein